ncbi:MAG: BtpA/SgcQ family protein [Clostridia bacterium]|nr:BtpA/SgcQ family protein [Clostridia bacterium]
MRDISFYKKGGKFIFGMVHCKALPGTAFFEDDMEKIKDLAVSDAINLEKAGVDAIIVENMGDDPFSEKLDIPQIAALAAISQKVSENVKIPLGIDAAMNDYEAAISIAKAVGADFVRIPVFVDTVEFTGGIIEPCARKAMILRKNLSAENIKILSDIQVKHSHMLLSHISIEDSAMAAQTCGADGIIVTGTYIGKETPIEIIQKVKKVTDIPIIVGSGFKKENAKSQLEIADGAIVGSSIKEGGIFKNPVSYELTKELIDICKS